uniref:Nucleocapsid protein n=1 Tax=Hymenopteran phasma-related virus OKIAV230 TaxID=2746314 RepID=A0A7D7JFC9_9VIRU|nr:nucleocapsid protein [Hymenopteran phasma-related virus OKIAV230]
MAQSRDVNVDIEGVTPNYLRNHLVARTYEIEAISASDFVSKHGAAEFDFESLAKEFNRHCPDYLTRLDDNSRFKSLDFCSKIVFEVGPESRQVRKGQADKTWRFIFNNPDGKHFVIVASFKNAALEGKVEKMHNCMVLTLKQAGLLAVNTFCKLAKICYNSSQTILLTPLAGACFAREDIIKIGEDLGDDVGDLLIRINSSCQGGGQYLRYSDGSFALVSALSATRNIKDENLRRNIVNKLIRQYINQGKTPEKKLVLILAKYASGGIPTELNYDEMVKLFEEGQRSAVAALQMSKAVRASTLRSQVGAFRGE